MKRCPFCKQKTAHYFGEEKYNQFRASGCFRYLISKIRDNLKNCGATNLRSLGDLSLGDTEANTQDLFQEIEKVGK